MGGSVVRGPDAEPATSKTWVERLWASVAERRPATGGPHGAVERAKALADALLSRRGEAAGAALAKELFAVIGALAPAERALFEAYLAEGFQPDAARLARAAETYLASPSAATAARLAEAAEPPRQEVLRRMNMAPGGTAALVAMRKALLARLREEPRLAPLDADLRHLFASWFNRGFLELRRIDWQTPAAVLEKLIAYEAVHEIQGWEDLRRRLAPDRRCFGFFHPALPGEPLIFVEVALTRGLATAVPPLLARDRDDAAQRERAAAADTAIFYSISNCQDGLRGVSFGNLLIKQVVEELKAELPQLVRFSTLSPIPGFRRWLDRALAAGEPLLRPEETGALEEAARAVGAAAGPPLDALVARDGWWTEAAIAEALRPPLTRLCAQYLTTGAGPKGPVDPVARFHLGNGARLERIDWLGNPAPRAHAESYGLMVNYLYDPETIEANHEAFVQDGVVARSAEVDALLAPARVRSRRGSLLRG